MKTCGQCKRFYDGECRWIPANNAAVPVWFDSVSVDLLRRRSDLYQADACAAFDAHGEECEGEAKS